MLEYTKDILSLGFLIDLRKTYYMYFMNGMALMLDNTAYLNIITFNLKLPQKDFGPSITLWIVFLSNLYIFFFLYHHSATIGNQSLDPF